jgi:hypothetical protein
MGVGGGDGVAAPAEDVVRRPWWRVRLSRLAVLLWVLVSAAVSTFLHWHLRHTALRKAEEGLVSTCEERARMLQDQFAVSVNHVHALAILVAAFHYEKHPPALDQVRLRYRRRRLLFSIHASLLEVALVVLVSALLQQLIACLPVTGNPCCLFHCHKPLDHVAVLALPLLMFYHFI